MYLLPPSVARTVNNKTKIKDVFIISLNDIDFRESKYLEQTPTKSKIYPPKEKESILDTTKTDILKLLF
ncbi:hypothetical protein VIBNISFn118_20021 [Vibrio nigripulchritudo SFn118]|nr:hypothetical protein VIBNISFn118_20021 [Vibrio nigripulchritudo SFn118]